MPADPSQALTDHNMAERIARLEHRVAELENKAAAAEIRTPQTSSSAAGGHFDSLPTDGIGETHASYAARNERIELEISQNWFARIGILVLAAGGVLLLSQPYPAIPGWAPAVAGYLITAVLFWVAHLWRQRFELVANYFRGAAMALLWFATLRLFDFGARPAIAIQSPAAPILFTLVLAANIAISLQRRSPRLFILALATGYGSAVAIGSAWYLLALAILLPASVAISERRVRWPLPLLAATVLNSATYLIWAAGGPPTQGSFHFIQFPAIAPVIVLSSLVVFALAAWSRRSSTNDSVLGGVAAALNCIFSYGAFLIHTAASFESTFVWMHAIASVVLISIAVLFHIRRSYLAPTFFYAMTGYAALSVAIMSATEVPNVFVWLSLESIVVVATAVWFRSRFIVVANFLIFVATTLGYMVLKNRETGISVGIGIVALASARILNWQKSRLELKTELMRNAYLVSAFVVFPYALYHLVPARHVALAWVGLALLYYLLNVFVRSPKYRWMGHATLAITTVYVVTAATHQLEPAYRVASLLALGTVLLAVSLTFSKLRQKKEKG